MTIRGATGRPHPPLCKSTPCPRVHRVRDEAACTKAGMRMCQRKGLRGLPFHTFGKRPGRALTPPCDARLTIPPPVVGRLPAEECRGGRQGLVPSGKSACYSDTAPQTTLLGRGSGRGKQGTVAAGREWRKIHCVLHAGERRLLQWTRVRAWIGFGLSPSLQDRFERLLDDALRPMLGQLGTSRDP